MATRKSPAEPQRLLELRVPISDATAKLDDRMAKGREILQLPMKDPTELDSASAQYRKWSEYNSQLLSSLFTTDQFKKDYEFWSVMSIPMNPTFQERRDDFIGDVKEKVRRLESIKERLELIPVAASAMPVNVAVASPAPRADKSKAFIVHGHDEAVREAAARFLENQGIQAIILHEQASRGLSVMEKLKSYSDVGFAVVLLTPDDLGRENKTGSIERPRARQNVILELGYFVSHLGSGRVCALRKGDVELPSDFLGIVHVPLDEHGSWKYVLAREMKAVGFDIDLNEVALACLSSNDRPLVRPDALRHEFLEVNLGSLNALVAEQVLQLT